MAGLDDFVRRLEKANTISLADYHVLYTTASECQDVAEPLNCNVKTDTLGTLLSLFVNPQLEVQSRRWIGVLVSELLKRFEVLRDSLEIVSEDVKRALGSVVISAEKEELKHITGSIILSARSTDVSKLPLEQLWSGEVLEVLAPAFSVQNETQLVQKLSDVFNDLSESGKFLECDSGLFWGDVVIQDDKQLLNQCGCIMLELDHHSLTIAAFPSVRQIMFLDVPFANINCVRHVITTISASKEPTSAVKLTLKTTTASTHVSNAQTVTSNNLTLVFDNQEVAKEFAADIRARLESISMNSPDHAQNNQSSEAIVPINQTPRRSSEVGKKAMFKSAVSLALSPMPEREAGDAGHDASTGEVPTAKLRAGMRDEEGRTPFRHSDPAAPTKIQKKALSKPPKSSVHTSTSQTSSGGKLVKKPSKKSQSQRSKRKGPETVTPQQGRIRETGLDIFEIPPDENGSANTALASAGIRRARDIKKKENLSKATDRESHIREDSTDDNPENNMPREVDPKRRTRASLGKKQQSNNDSRSIYTEPDSDDEMFEAPPSSPKDLPKKKAKAKELPASTSQSRAPKQTRSNATQKRSETEAQEVGITHNDHSGEETHLERTVNEGKSTPMSVPPHSDELNKKPAVIKFDKNGPINQGTMPKPAENCSAPNTEPTQDETQYEDIDAAVLTHLEEDQSFPTQSHGSEKGDGEVENDSIGNLSISVVETLTEGNANHGVNHGDNVACHEMLGLTTKEQIEEPTPPAAEIVPEQVAVAKTVIMTSTSEKTLPPRYPWPSNRPTAVHQDLSEGLKNPFVNEEYSQELANADLILLKQRAEAETRNPNQAMPNIQAYTELSRPVISRTRFRKYNITTVSKTSPIVNKLRKGKDSARQTTMVNTTMKMKVAQPMNQNIPVMSDVLEPRAKQSQSTQPPNSKNNPAGRRAVEMVDEALPLVTHEIQKRPAVEPLSIPHPKRPKQVHVDLKLGDRSNANAIDERSRPSSELEQPTGSQMSARVDSQGSPYPRKTRLPLYEASPDHINRLSQKLALGTVYYDRSQSGPSSILKENMDDEQSLIHGQVIHAESALVNVPIKFTTVSMQTPRNASEFCFQGLPKKDFQLGPHEIKISETRGTRVLEIVEPLNTIVKAAAVPKELSPPRTHFEKLLNSRAPPRDTSVVKKNSNQEPASWNDAEKTLVGVESSGRRHHATVANAEMAEDEDFSSSDEEGSFEVSEEEEPEAEESTETGYEEEMEWEETLKPHQKTYVKAVCRIAQRLLTHVIDGEAATSSIIKDYQTNGKMLINDMVRCHQEDHDKFTTAATNNLKEMINTLGGVAQELRQNRGEMTSICEKMNRRESGRVEGERQGLSGVQRLLAQYGAK